MRSNVFKLTFSSMLLLLGITSCKKDCEDCFTYTYGGRRYTYCESDFANRSQFEYYRNYYVLNYGATETEQCD